MTGHDANLWTRTKPRLQTDFLIREKIPGWLGNVEGKNVLDAGCGEGYVARMLANLGAKVKALDVDSKMILLAKSVENKFRRIIEYQVGDILELNKIYKKSEFDIALLSGVAPFLDKRQLLDVCKKIYYVLEEGAVLLLTTNHTRSYFEKAESNWLEFLTEPDPKLQSQNFRLNFYTPDKQKAFTGEAWIHTPEQIKKILVKSGFHVDRIYEPLAKEEKNHFPYMWGDEDKIPYHLVVIGVKSKYMGVRVLSH